MELLPPVTGFEMGWCCKGWLLK